MYKAALDRTNMYRQRHHAQKLVEDASIAKTAIAWANSMSDKGSFEHNIHEIRKLGYGENIAWRGSSAVLSMSPTSCAGKKNTFLYSKISYPPKKYIDQNSSRIEYKIVLKFSVF